MPMSKDHLHLPILSVNVTRKEKAEKFVRDKVLARVRGRG